MFRTNISREEINQLDQYYYQGNIHLIDEQNQIKEVFGHISGHSYVGFDTETKPSFVKGDKNKVSLIQIAIPDKVFLLRIHKTGIGNELINFLENEQILKVGVAIHNDAKELQQISNFKPKGFLEIPDLTGQLGIEAKGLRGLAAIILKIRISKGAKITNWEAEQLSKKQLQYAATDAWVCMEMYRKLHELGLV